MVSGMWFSYLGAWPREYQHRRVMEDLLAHLGKIIGQQQPRKISGAFWYRTVYKTRRDSIMTVTSSPH